MRSRSTVVGLWLALASAATFGSSDLVAKSLLVEAAARGHRPAARRRRDAGPRRADHPRPAWPLAPGAREPRRHAGVWCMAITDCRSPTSMRCSASTSGSPFLLRTSGSSTSVVLRVGPHAPSAQRPDRARGAPRGDRVGARARPGRRSGSTWFFGVSSYAGLVAAARTGDLLVLAAEEPGACPRSPSPGSGWGPAPWRSPCSVPSARCRCGSWPPTSCSAERRSPGGRGRSARWWHGGGIPPGGHGQADPRFHRRVLRGPDRGDVRGALRVQLLGELRVVQGLGGSSSGEWSPSGSASCAASAAAGRPRRWTGGFPSACRRRLDSPGCLGKGRCTAPPARP